MSFGDFSVFTFDADFRGDGWSASYPYTSKLTVRLRDLINSAHDFTYLGVHTDDNVRRQTHVEILNLAKIVDLIVKNYCSAMLDQEAAEGITEQYTQFARYMLPTSAWLEEALSHNRSENVSFSLQAEIRSNAASRTATITDIAFPITEAELEVNLIGTAALMDIDEGLLLLQGNNESNSRWELEAINLFLGAANGVRIATVKETHMLADSEPSNGLDSDRAKLLASKRHETTTRLRQYAIELYRARNWPSKLQAAKHITPELKVMAREINATALRGERAQQTVYEWIRSVKD